MSAAVGTARRGRAAVGNGQSAVGEIERPSKGFRALVEAAHAAAGVDREIERVVIEHAEASIPVSAAMAAREVDHG